MALTVAEALNELSVHIQDPAHQLLNRAQLTACINSAAWDASAEGWVIETQDESLSLGSSDYEYDVPAGIAYIHEIWMEAATGTGTYPTFIPYYQWQIVMDTSSTPAIHFSRDSFTPTASIDLRLKGQTRPTVEYSSETSNIDAGMEAFLRERAVMYAARNLSRKEGAQAQSYLALAQEAFQISELLMQQQAEFFRPKKYSRAVPGR